MALRYRFVDCRYDLADPAAARRAYVAAHIPGAAFMSLEDDLSGSQGGGRHPLPSADDFARSASGAGIDAATFVVAYGDGAARLWWLLRHFGHDGCSVLRGGIEAWLGPLRSGDEQIEPAVFTARPRSGDTIDADELHARLGEPGLVVVDARAPERYRGEVEPIDPVAGRIPGAINWPYARAAPEAVSDTIAKAHEIVAYCGSGVSACADLLALALAARPDAKLYPGSWSDWSSRGLPVERG